MAWPTSVELVQLVASFRRRTVTASAFTHRAHLAVGSWHVHHLGARLALVELRSGIQRLNDAHGTPNSDTRGYHETITCAYVQLIDQFLAGHGDAGLVAKVQALVAGPLAATGLLLSFYTRDRLMSVEARRRWVEPDLAPLSISGRGGDKRRGDSCHNSRS